MSEIRFSCPECRTAMRTTNPAHAGKKVKCPKCGTMCTIPKPAEEVVEILDDIQVEAIEEKAAPATATSAGAVGQRVFARWQDGFWYPATVRFADADEVMVKYDDGSAGSVTPAQVRPLVLKEGERVQARWEGGPSYYPGKVAKWSAEKVSVHYDDGERETIGVDLIRVIRPEDVPWKEGDRVLANWMPEPFFYPAVVTEVSADGFVSVDYDDGDSAELMPGQVLPLNLRKGDRVFAKRKPGKMYMPATIVTLSGAELKVRYEDDGFEEKTSVKVLRVLPGTEAPS